MSREENVEMMRLQIKVIDADRMAAIVDEMVRGRRLDARSKLADARLDYGKPFDPDGMRQGAEMLESTRARADYWLEGGRDDANRDTAVLSVEQAANAWKNAAYALAEKLAKTTPPEALRIGWIRVEERLPELQLYPRDPKDPEDYDWWRSWSVFCAVTTPDGKREVRKGMYYKTPDSERWETEYGQWDAEGIVTHWFKRPEWPELPETTPSPLARSQEKT